MTRQSLVAAALVGAIVSAIGLAGASAAAADELNGNRGWETSANRGWDADESGSPAQ